MNIIGEAETAITPYAALIKWGAIALVALAILGVGIGIGRYTAAVTTAKSETKTAHCETARATDNGNANAAAAGALAQGGAGAAKADAGSAAADSTTGQHYDQAQQEANHAKPSGATIDAAPLRALFRGMRDDAAAAGAADADRGDAPAAAVH